MRCLVTGGSGFIGSALAKRLLADGHEVLVTGSRGEQYTGCHCLSYSFHDLDWKSIPPLDVVFHQAAISCTTHPDPDDFYAVNVRQPQMLFEQAFRHGCRSFVYASSCAVYGSMEPPFRETSIPTPLNAYGASKLLFDEWATEWAGEAAVWPGIPSKSPVVVGLRYSNVYGPGESHKGSSASMVWQLAEQIRSGKRPRLFKWGEQERDFVHIDDVVNANLLAANCGSSGVFNVGQGRSASFNKVAGLIGEFLGVKVDVEYIDNPIQAVYQSHTVCDLTLSRKLLGYSPQVSLEDGVRLLLTAPR